METWIWIILIVLAFVAGGVLGMFITRKMVQKQLKENPPINEKMIRAMYAQMGRKPSEKQIRQILSSTLGEQ